MIKPISLITTALFLSTVNSYAFESKDYPVKLEPQIVGVASTSSEQMNVVLAKDGKTTTIFELHFSEYPFSYRSKFCDSNQFFKTVKPLIQSDYQRIPTQANESKCEIDISIWKSDETIEYSFNIVTVNGFKAMMQTPKNVFVTTTTDSYKNSRKQLSNEGSDGISLKRITN